VRRLIRKPKNPMGKNWERIPKPNAVAQTFGVKGKKKCREKN